MPSMPQVQPAAVEPQAFGAVLRAGFRAMACACEIVIAGADDAAARRFATRAAEEVRRIERAYSRYRDGSIVARINASAGRAAVSCDGETLWLLEQADAAWRASDGLFDPTAGVLRRAWDFKAARLPTHSEIDALLPLIGWARVQRDGRRVHLPLAGMELDFGGFGKEYAADRAAAVLAETGVRHGYVNLGGDLRVIGPRPDGTPWIIGIRDPRSAGVVATIPVSAGGLATSGDYERFFELDGRRYCHLLDPRTGWPVAFWRSVSVLAETALAAGLSSTIAMLQADAALQRLRALGLDFMAIGPQGNIHLADGAADRLAGSPPPPQ